MKLSKKFIEENIFYLKTGKRHRVCYDELCKSCENECKQSYKITAIACPAYKPKKKAGWRLLYYSIKFYYIYNKGFCRKVATKEKVIEKVAKRLVKERNIFLLVK